MSRGHFNYVDQSLKSEMFGYCDKRETDPMEDIELSQMLYEMLDLIYDLDSYLSGDSGEERYLNSKKKFKNKWLRNKTYNRDVLAELIDSEISDTREKLLKMIE